MEKKNDDLTQLFRNRLRHMQMDVRDGFWEELQADLPHAVPPRLSWPRLRVWAAAASVLLILGSTLAAFWHFSPQDEIKEAFTQVEAWAPPSPMDVESLRHPDPPSVSLSPQLPVSSPHALVPERADSRSAQGQEPEAAAVSVRFSIQITRRTAGRQPVSRQPAMMLSAQSDYGLASDADCAEDGRDKALSDRPALSSPWSLKVGLGTALPDGACRWPLSVSVLAERRLTSRLSLGAGLQYDCLPMSASRSASGDVHALAIPVKLNYRLADFSRVGLYATVGGAVHKPVGHHAAPVHLSASAGVGVDWRIGSRLALFAEPSATCHFGGEGRLPGLYGARPLNLNLLCGVRVCY